MWGNILTEVSYMQNFNMSFSNNKADVLIHLTQWQYWWWFWFSFLWALYYLLVARVFRYRTLKFNPRIASTLRPHGKWGDLLTCLIPVTWCLNILINSNFILKLIEWQSESSLFTLRVRAKQWYWVYKLDLRNISDIFSAPRNVGRNKWQFATFGDLQTAEDYLHIMQMRAYNSWSKDFWSELGKKSNKKNRFNITTPVETYKFEFLKNANLTFYRCVLDSKNLFTINQQTNVILPFVNEVETKYNLLPLNPQSLLEITLKEFKFNLLEINKIQKFKKPFLFVSGLEDPLLKENILKKTQPLGEKKQKPGLMDFGFTRTKTWDSSEVEAFNTFFQKEVFGGNGRTKTTIQHPDLDDETRIIKRNSGKNTPIRVLKCPSSDFFFKSSINDTTNIELLRFRFNEQKPTLANKPVRPTVYLTFKQKRYNQRNNIGKKTQMFFDKDLKNKQTYSGNPFLKNMSIIEENFGNPTRQYRLVKKAKSRLDTTRVASWNRLLRSRRVLVLPAHINITVITNSFDVVHSWHIPGLGLKMDCLPGRATHHTLYIDNVGLYYGQCAEICGRYHHHMPIRVCALPFEHFLVWWHTFGLPKFLFSSNKDKMGIPVNKYFARKFSW
jgi:heme/copper-type cytochrome/quinol oxidase subunit 2